ncbi:DUF2950 family protein [Paraburkholderia sp.]|uniref:DUF2950 family protein n=1 Tax=Paraburkholderia sp. TaxID=1926495 RepID=UPI0039E68408
MDVEKESLIWTTVPGEAESPLGPLAATMPARTRPQEAYHGYHYRILTAQGPHAQGGAHDYVDNGVMSRGFALIASPAGLVPSAASHEAHPAHQTHDPGTCRVPNPLLEPAPAPV